MKINDVNIFQLCDNIKSLSNVFTNDKLSNSAKNLDDYLHMMYGELNTVKEYSEIELNALATYIVNNYYLKWQNIYNSIVDIYSLNKIKKTSEKNTSENINLISAYDVDSFSNDSKNNITDKKEKEETETDIDYINNAIDYFNEHLLSKIMMIDVIDILAVKVYSF